MRKVTREKKVLVACVLLSSALILAAAGWRLETRASGTWAVGCEIEGLDFCYVGLQVEDTRYLADIGIENSRLYTSHDGCIWSEVEISVFDETVDKWRNDLALFKTLDNNLGMVWVDTEPSAKKKPRAAYFLSTFDGQDWSAPVFLFYRENYCVDLVDAMPFDNGDLLLLWKEPVYLEINGKKAKGTGCNVIYSALVTAEEIITVQVFETDSPSFCYTKGFHLIIEGERIWCVFDHRTPKFEAYYRVWTEDGKTWSQPEEISLPTSEVDQIFKTAERDIAVFEYQVDGNNGFLYKSRDWKTWSKTKIFNSKEMIRGAYLSTDENGNDWGLLQTEKGLFLIAPSEENFSVYERTTEMVDIFYGASLATGVFSIVLLVWGIWSSFRP
ncbi:MAG: hypothetical protein HXS52_14585 [Theionarchaea archaeon]|nr:hypothetical protein [Theionarchaea archaeon]MBU7039152.1 hypothetical protein [Theionarchaea archaeon]